MQTLDGVTAGTYLVQTSSGSRYRLDLTAREAIREAQVTEPAPGDVSVPLRRDGEALTLEAVVACTVGEDLVVVLGKVDTYAGYLATTRYGTTVVSITEVTA